MSSTNKTIIAFDLYGTLLSTESIAKELATHFGDEKASSIAELWRRYQLEYTWRMNSMGIFPLAISLPESTTKLISSSL
jgi:2-haloacid dehalogenase